MTTYIYVINGNNEILKKFDAINLTKKQYECVRSFTFGHNGWGEPKNNLLVLANSDDDAIDVLDKYDAADDKSGLTAWFRDHSNVVCHSNIKFDALGNLI